MGFSERGLPEHVVNPKKKGPELPAGESYDVAGPKAALRKLEKNPKVLDKFAAAARGRAEDIFESGKLKDRISPGDKVLYLGAGSGHVAKYIEEQTGAKVFKFDIADLRTPDTKDNKFAIANARNLPIGDGTLDKICLFDMLHHTQNQDEILREALRVLKPGGKCLIMEDTIPEPYERGVKPKKWLVGKMDDAFNLQGKGVNPHGYHSVSDWELKFHELGFEVDANKNNSWHWGLADFAGADRKTRPDKNTLARPFEATMFEIGKPEQESK